MRARWLIVLAATALAAVMCNKPTPVAPAEAGLTISANPTRIELGATAEVTVIARKSDGNPVNQGTEINFSTTLGTLSAVVANTNDRGVASVDLLGGSEVGTASVTASSGAATPVTVEIQVGSLAASIDLIANPGQVPQDGGTVNLVATVFDDRGNFLRNRPVNFETEAGTLASGGSAQRTDANGEARDTLTLTRFDLERLPEDFFLAFARTTTEGGLLLETDAEIGVGGFPASITLSTDSSSVPAEGGSLGLTALVRDDGGNPSVGAGVNFLTDVGSLATGGRLIQTDANGQAFDTLTVTQQELSAVAAAQTTFQVTAEVAGRGGQVFTDTRNVGIQGDRPRAQFGFTRTNDTVAFENQTAGAMTILYLWDFGDGATSAAVNPSHMFAVGSYMVSLTATNDFGEDTVIETVVVDPIARFSFQIDGGDPKKIQFNDLSETTGGALSYLWEFGDGSSSTDSDPEHTYGGAGTFSVTLTVSNDQGSDSRTVTVAVS